LQPDPPSLSETPNGSLAKSEHCPRPPYSFLTLGIERVLRVEGGSWAGAPKAAVLPSGLARGRKEVGRVAAAVSVEEPGRSGSPSDEVEVDVGTVLAHIRQCAPESVALVEGRIPLALDLGACREKSAQVRLGLAGVALSLVGLRCVQL